MRYIDAGRRRGDDWTGALPQMKKGEVYAFLGDCGAGKTSLLRALCAAPRTDRTCNPSLLIDVFSVTDNLLFGARERGIKPLRRAPTRAHALSLCELYGIAVDLDAEVRDIPVGQWHRIEILNMLMHDEEVLLLDEPTPGLTPQQADDLFALMRRVALAGKTVAFSTRKPEDAHAAADRCAVLRGGRIVGERDAGQTTIEELRLMMYGREVTPSRSKKALRAGSVTLEARGLTARTPGGDAVCDVSFEICEGEIVGIAGVPGSGQQALVAALTGEIRAEDGHIKLHGRDITRASVHARAALGVGCIPDALGTIPALSVADNLILRRYAMKPYCAYGFLKRVEIEARAEEVIEQYGMDADADTPLRELSHIDKQKLIAAREIDRATSLLIAVRPTRGLPLDIALDIQSHIVKIRDMHRSALLISDDMEELFNLSDRVLVLREGEIVGEFDPAFSTARELGLYMTGSLRQNKYLRPGDEALL